MNWRVISYKGGYAVSNGSGYLRHSTQGHVLCFSDPESAQWYADNANRKAA